MKLLTASLALVVGGFSVTALAEQQYLESRSLELRPVVAISAQKPMQKPTAALYQTNIAELSPSNITILSNSFAAKAAALDLIPKEIVASDASGLAVSELGVALSFPLSIVNMPIAVAVSTKFQRLDTFNYDFSDNRFGVNDVEQNDETKMNDETRINDETRMNFDLGFAMQPMENVTVALSGRNLVNHCLLANYSLEIDTDFERQFIYHIEPLYSARLAFDGSNYRLATEVELNSNKRFNHEADTQYWYFSGELRPVNWLALRLGYRHEVKDSSEDIYSFGTGFSIGESFNFDLTGVLGSDDTLGGVIQTSYHF